MGFLYSFFLLTQHLAIIALIFEILYVATMSPSRFQVEMLLLTFATLVMLLGYSIELYATSANEALAGAALSYVGKPFALLLSLVFVADFCGKPISNRFLRMLFPVCLFFPIIVLTNGTAEGTGHHLYYRVVEFNSDNLYSPLNLSRGPLYWLYAVYLLGAFGAIVVYIVQEMRRNGSRKSRAQLGFILAMMISTVAGYLVYMSGVTGGYDTTMTGASVGTFCLAVVFFRYKLFDTLTLAKDTALHNASVGIIVEDERGKVVYTNAMVEMLLKKGVFTIEELMHYPLGTEIIEKGESVYEVTNASVEKKGVCYGKTVELTDITAQYRYNTQLEHDVEVRTKEIVNIQRSAIVSFAGIVEARDSSTGVHIKRMSRIVGLIAKELMKKGIYPDVLNDSYVEHLVEVAPLHDVGKITIPDAILLKPGRLTDDEFAVIKTHSAKGAELLKECLDGVERQDYVSLACDVARHHHEKWNGTGYPDRLVGEAIPLSSRIVAVADVYDAVRSERCYKPPMSKEEARAVIEEGRGTHFDPAVVDAFLSALPEIEAE